MRVAKIQTTQDHISRDGLANSAASLVPPGTILVVARSGVLKHAVPIAVTSCSLAFNQDIKAVVPDISRIESEYLYWLLKSRESQILREGVKLGATVHSLRSGYLEGLKFKLPPIPDQRRIVDILNRASGIVRLRREALEKTRQLIPALFVAMFGDPATNPMGWPVTTLGRVIRQADYGSSRKASEVRQSGIPIIRMGNVDTRGDLTLEDLKYVTACDVDLTRYRLEQGDILFNRTNSKDLVGKTGLWNGQLTAVPASYFIRVRLDQSRALPQFVWAFLNSRFMKRRLFETARGAIGQANINARELKAFAMPLPGIERQGSFAEQVSEIQSTIAQQQRMAKAADELLASLMARLFDGQPT